MGGNRNALPKKLVLELPSLLAPLPSILFFLRRHRPQPVGDGLEQGYCETRFGLHQSQEVAAADGQQLAIRIGDRGRRSRGLIDQRHLAEGATGTDPFDDDLVDRHRSPATDDVTAALT